MIRVRFLASFDESVSRLDGKQRAKTRMAVNRLLDYFSGGAKPLGLGLRKLREPYWELRAGLERRVVFTLRDDLATFVIVATHDEVRRILR